MTSTIRNIPQEVALGKAEGLTRYVAEESGIMALHHAIRVPKHHGKPPERARDGRLQTIPVFGVPGGLHIILNASRSLAPEFLGEFAFSPLLLSRFHIAFLLR